MKRLVDTRVYNIRKFAVTTFVALIFGIVVGCAANPSLNYSTAIGMVLGCAYGVDMFNALGAAFLYPKFEKYPRGKKITFQMLSPIIVHILAWILLVWIAGLILGFNFFQWGTMVWLAIFIVMLVIATSIRQLLKFNRELREKDKIEERLKVLATQAELKALKAQINPHFLFNSLNTVASLTNTDPQRAEEATLKLADVFRYTLSSSNREFVSLQDELDFLDSYLGVEKARFGDRLAVTKSIQPDVLKSRIPSLILQPLVENCLKHGRNETGSAEVEIKCFSANGAINIEIGDRGKGAPEEIKRGIFSKGTGLRNVNERLLKTYFEGFGLKIKDNAPHGMLASIATPKEKACC